MCARVAAVLLVVAGTCLQIYNESENVLCVLCSSEEKKRLFVRDSSPTWHFLTNLCVFLFVAQAGLCLCAAFSGLSVPAIFNISPVGHLTVNSWGHDTICVIVCAGENRICTPYSLNIPFTAVWKTSGLHYCRRCFYCLETLVGWSQKLVWVKEYFYFLWDDNSFPTITKIVTWNNDVIQNRSESFSISIISLKPPSCSVYSFKETVKHLYYCGLTETI